MNFEYQVSYRVGGINPYNHRCFLPPPDVVTMYIRPGRLWRLRKWIRNATTVSIRSPHLSIYVKSSAALRKEYTRHMAGYYYVIHPLSDFRWWSCVAESVFLWTYFLLVPFMFLDKWAWLRQFKLALDVISLVYIFGVTFHVGLLNERWHAIVLDPKTIRRKYLKGYFLIDLISSLPIDYFMHRHKHPTENWYIMILPCIKLLRLPTLVKNFKFLRKWKSIGYVSFYSVIVYYSVCIVYASCFSALSVLYTSDIELSWYDYPLYPTGTTSVLLLSVYRSIYTIMLIGNYGRTSWLMADCVCDMCFMTMGYFLVFFIQSIFMRLIDNWNWSERNYERLVMVVKEYLGFKKIPQSLREKVLTYYEFRYQLQMYNDAGMLASFPEELQNEIFYAVRLPHIEEADFLRDLPISLKHQLCLVARRVTYLCGDLITRVGAPAQFMFFVDTGSVAVFDASGKELCHYEDKTFFGEIGLVADVERSVSVVAVEHTEILMLFRNDFWLILRKYPDYLANIKYVIQRRAEYIL